MNEVLVIMDFDNVEKIEEISNEILHKLEDRNNAKLEKNFELADKLRDELLELGYKIVDSREGSRIEKL
jgi:cysteinyl-tRNA synthetase